MSASKCFKGKFVSSSKNQVKIQNCSEDWFQGGGAKNEWLGNIGHSMSMSSGSQQWLRFHICFILILYYKIGQILLYNATAILLQNATKGYYKMCQVFYFKMPEFCFKMQQLVQYVTVNTKCFDFITKCASTIIKDDITKI